MANNNDRVHTQANFLTQRKQIKLISFTRNEHGLRVLGARVWPIFCERNIFLSRANTLRQPSGREGGEGDKSCDPLRQQQYLLSKDLRTHFNLSALCICQWLGTLEFDIGRKTKNSSYRSRVRSFVARQNQTELPTLIAIYNNRICWWNTTINQFHRQQWGSGDRSDDTARFPIATTCC